MEEQVEIPGTERRKCRAIEAAAAAYVKERDARMKQGKKEVEAKKKLREACKKNMDFLSPHPDEENVFVYRYGDEIVELTHKEDEIKVRAAEEEE